MGLFESHAIRYIVAIDQRAPGGHDRRRFGYVPDRLRRLHTSQLRPEIRRKITLRHSVPESRNSLAIRLAESLGIKNVIDYSPGFGISEPIPARLLVAL